MTDVTPTDQTDDEPLWYVMHKHGDHPAHAHSTRNTHPGNIPNTEHTGIRTQTFEEDRAQYKKRFST